MRSNRFRHRIIIEAPTETKGLTGALVVSYAEVERRWAEALPTPSREAELLRQRFSEGEAVYRMRGYLDITTSHRLVHDGQVFDIVGVETDGNRHPLHAPLVTIICRGRR